MALGAVDEDRDGQEIVADRQLAAGEDRPARDAELMVTAFAFEQRAGLVGIDAHAAAARANRLAVGVSPTDLPESVAGLLLGHARNLRQT